MRDLHNCTAALLKKIREPRATRDDVAVIYALAEQASEQTDWHMVEMAIVDRWSPHAFTYIKRQAWRRVRARLVEAIEERRAA